jgi:spore coat polysaccharide biosynthesis protein SpsF
VSNIGVVILSRFSSSRLPGKALMEISGKKVLEYIIERVQQVYPLDKIVLATSNEKSDNPIAAFARAYGVKLYRGSLENVSRRFYTAAKEQNWDYAVRVNGDNIFIDTQLLRDLTHIILENKYDFISNVKGRTFPRGMSIEIVSLEHYKELLPIIEADNNYREHVTLYLYDHEIKDRYNFIMNTTLPKAAGIQMALDTKKDFERSDKIIQKFVKDHYKYNLTEIFTLLQSINDEE